VVLPDCQTDAKAVPGVHNTKSWKALGYISNCWYFLLVPSITRAENLNEYTNLIAKF